MLAAHRDGVVAEVPQERSTIQHLPAIRPGIAWMVVLSLLVFRDLPGAQGQTRLSAGVDLVKVDVSVLDKQEHPVPGLAAGDFTVLEDGKSQTIQAFASVELPEPDLKSAAWTRAVAPDVMRNTEADDDRLVVLVLDDAMVPSDPMMVANTKTIAKGVVARLGPRDLAAVVFTRDNRHAQEFTHDSARLLAAIETFASAGHDPAVTRGLEVTESGLYVSSISALGRLATILESAPDRRKAVVWISVGIPSNPWEVASGTGWQVDLYYRWVDAINAARRANVNIYSVDPAGLDGVRFYIAQRLAQAQGTAPSDEAGSDRAGLYRSFLQAMSADTGGRAFVNSNEFSTKIDEIFRETGSFYLVGYASTNPAANGRFRKIQVKVNRPGVTVHNRTGYYAPAPSTAKASPPAPAVPVNALSGLLPERGLPMQMTLAPFAVAGQPAAVVATVHLSAAESVASAAATLVVEAFTFDGAPRETVRTQVPVTSTTGATAEFQTVVHVSLPPGRYQIRAGANAGGLAGSVYGDVDVPDFAKAPLSISGLILGAHANTLSRDDLAALVPMRPTTARTFHTTDRVDAFARVYASEATAPGAVTLRTRIVDTNDAIMADATTTLAAGRFVDRAAEVNYPLPLSSLAPGAYLLSFEAAAGKTLVRRDVRFVVAP